MTISGTSSSSYYLPTVTGLTVLAQASATATQLATEREVSIIGGQIQNRLNAKIAALQQPADAALTQSLQASIDQLTKQQTAISALSSQYGTNANMLSDLQTQLAGLQTAAANGDSATFDATLAAANTNVSDLTPIVASAPFQPDRIGSLLNSGLGIGSSASYDLSTPAGQAAAAQDVKNAQNLIGQIFAVIGSNQIIAGSMTTSLSSHLSSLSSQLNQLQNSSQTATQIQILQLTQQAQDQVHLIELALGNSQSLANMLSLAANPPQPVNSVFGALLNATSSNPTSAPAILSMFA